MAATSTPLIPFEAVLEPAPTPNGIADDHSLLKIDQELDLLLERIEDEIEEKRERSERQPRDNYVKLCKKRTDIQIVRNCHVDELSCAR